MEDMLENIEIAEMRSTHLADVCEIAIFSFPIPWSYDSFSNELNNKLATYIVASKNDKVVGFGGIWVIFDESHITNIAVHPDYRGLGIGDILMGQLIKKSYDKGAKDITLEVRRSNIVAQNLYMKYGFAQDGVRKKYYQDNGEDAIIMWKREIKV